MGFAGVMLTDIDSVPGDKAAFFHVPSTLALKLLSLYSVTKDVSPAPKDERDDEWEIQGNESKRSLPVVVVVDTVSEVPESVQFAFVASSGLDWRASWIVKTT